MEAMHNNNIDPWLPQTTKEDWKFENENLYFKHYLYIPEEAQHQLVTNIHEPPARGHGGFFWTLHLLQKDYWWLGMSTFLRKFVSGCTLCQMAKINTHPTVSGLTPLVVESSTPFFSISVDLISGLPPSNGFDSVMVVVNHGLTKGVIFCPCTKEINTAGVAILFFHHVFPQFGLYSEVISDQGSQFASAFTWELACLLQYNIALSTAYISFSNQQGDRMGQPGIGNIHIFSYLPQTNQRNGCTYSQWQSFPTTLLPIPSPSKPCSCLYSATSPMPIPLLARPSSPTLKND